MTDATGTEPVASAAATVPQAIHLRPMRRQDLDVLLVYEDEMFGTESWSRASYEDELRDTETRHYVVAEQGETVLGSAGLMTIAETAQILTVAVLPPNRRRGIGTMLVRELVAEARRRQATEVLLEVRTDNPAASLLYESEGFVTIGFRRGYYDHGRVDAAVMRYAL